MLYKDKKGNKLYPVCSWEENQHKLYNALDRAHNALYDAMSDNDIIRQDKVEAEIDRIERALFAFDRYVINGIVYAKWEDVVLIRDYVAAYNARH